MRSSDNPTFYPISKAIWATKFPSVSLPIVKCVRSGMIARANVVLCGRCDLCNHPESASQKILECTQKQATTRRKWVVLKNGTTEINVSRWQEICYWLFFTRWYYSSSENNSEQKISRIPRSVYLYWQQYWRTKQTQSLCALRELVYRSYRSRDDQRFTTNPCLFVWWVVWFCRKD